MTSLFLDDLLTGKDLSRAQACEAMHTIMAGEASQPQIAAFLVALRAKGETVDEIAGCAEAMRSHAVSVRPKRTDLVDTAGTGGDGAGTFNISTAAALLAAAAGAGVAKHGNRAASSACGSADVLEALGFEIDQPAHVVERSIDEFGFGFLFAPSHHPAMRHAAPVRRELGTRTVFNLLGPLTNPADAGTQVVGVYSSRLVRTIAEVLAQLGTRHAFVVHGAGGIDEFSPLGANVVAEVADGAVVDRVVEPEDLGISRCPPGSLSGGDPSENAELIRRVFEGERGARREATLFNAAAAIAAANATSDLRVGLELARDALDSGAGGDRLEVLVAFSKTGVPA